MLSIEISSTRYISNSQNIHCIAAKKATFHEESSLSAGSQDAGSSQGMLGAAGSGRQLQAGN